MAFFDNGLKIGTGLAIGLGIIILAPAIAPAVAAVVRPVAKASIKSGVILFEKARELIAEAMESVEDLAAEAHAELVQESRQQTCAPVSGVVDGADAY
ncbi:MAG: DUF5132 domain-containing protein [Syntrophobacteraceae bacterium]|jgi:hypothetical protein